MSIDDQGLTMTVYTVTPDALVGEVATLMVTHGVGDVIVVEEGKPVGILTDRDLVARVMAAGLDGKTVLVRDIMSTPPVTVPRNEEVGTAIALMSHHGIRRLPIVDEAGRLVSILTLDDIIMLSLDGRPELSNIVRRQLRLGDGPPLLPIELQRAGAKGSGRPATLPFSGTVESIAHSSMVIPVTQGHIQPLRDTPGAWLSRNRFWIVIVILLSILGTLAALATRYFVGAIYQYNPQYYEPKDIQRQQQLLEEELKKQEELKRK